MKFELVSEGGRSEETLSRATRWPMRAAAARFITTISMVPMHCHLERTVSSLVVSFTAKHAIAPNIGLVGELGPGDDRELYLFPRGSTPSTS